MKRLLCSLFLCLWVGQVAYALNDAQPEILCTDSLNACISNEPFDMDSLRSGPDAIVVAQNANKKRQHAPRSMPSKRPATGGRVFVFNPKRLAWGAYNANGELIRSGRASGGKGYCRDVRRRCRTPIGHFRVYRKGSSGCRSSKFPLGRGGAPMPYCMFFYHGFAIHGSPDVPNYNASHGCVRVLPSAAQWLHGNFIRHGTKVIVQPY